MTPEVLRMLAMYISGAGGALAGKDSVASGIDSLTQNYVKTQSYRDYLQSQQDKQGEWLKQLLEGGGKLLVDGSKTKIEMPNLTGSSGGPMTGVEQVGGGGTALSQGANTSLSESPSGIRGGFDPKMLAFLLSLGGGGNSPFASSLPTGAALAGLTPEDLTRGAQLKLGQEELAQRERATAAEAMVTGRKLEQAERGLALEGERNAVARQNAQLATDREERIANKPSAYVEEYKGWSEGAKARGEPSDEFAFLQAKGSSSLLNDFRRLQDTGELPPDADFLGFKLAMDVSEYDKYRREELAANRTPKSRYQYGIDMASARASASRPTPAETQATSQASAEGAEAVHGSAWIAGKGLTDFVADAMKKIDPGVRAKMTGNPKMQDETRRQLEGDEVRRYYSVRGVTVEFAEGPEGLGWYDKKTEKLLRLWKGSK